MPKISILVGERRDINKRLIIIDKDTFTGIRIMRVSTFPSFYALRGRFDGK